MYRCVSINISSILYPLLIFEYSAAPETCTSEGHLRLTGGSVSTEGRVEICLGGVWGTVCNDRWSDQNAQVVCRQLNHTPIGMC